MHRHGYKGRKFGRQRDQRRALLKGLASNLVIQESIVTTKPKAKELVPYLEKLITKAKIGDLHNRRQVISKMANVESANKLVDEIAPKLGGRKSGYLRIKVDKSRRGDNAEMARVSFVDDLAKTTKVAEPVKKPAESKPAVADKKPAKKPSVKKTTSVKKPKEAK
jgi:large subunit ribosomal protein L17